MADVTILGGDDTLVQVCEVAPVPGQTKVWQYVTLMKRVFLIDCPGVVYARDTSTRDDAAMVLKGVVRIERLEDAGEFIPEVLRRVKPDYLVRRLPPSPPTFLPGCPSPLLHPFLSHAGAPLFDFVPSLTMFACMPACVPPRVMCRGLRLWAQHACVLLRSSWIAGGLLKARCWSSGAALEGGSQWFS